MNRYVKSVKSDFFFLFFTSYSRGEGRQQLASFVRWHNPFCGGKEAFRPCKFLCWVSLIIILNLIFLFLLADGNVHVFILYVKLKRVILHFDARHVFMHNWEGAIAQLVECAPPGQEVVGLIPVLDTRSLLVGFKSVLCDRLRQKSWFPRSVSKWQH